MKNKTGVRFGVAAIVVAAVAALGLGAASRAADAPVYKVGMIKVSAKRFDFVPNQLTLKLGQPADIELTSLDVPMGFNVPDMATRATLVPGQIIHVHLTPQKVGTFGFLCDVFCGSGHEDMNGLITVIP